jgi:hypothetical protein
VYKQISREQSASILFIFDLSKPLLFQRSWKDAKGFALSFEKQSAFPVPTCPTVIVNGVRRLFQRSWKMLFQRSWKDATNRVGKMHGQREEYQVVQPLDLVRKRLQGENRCLLFYTFGVNIWKESREKRRKNVFLGHLKDQNVF